LNKIGCLYIVATPIGNLDDITLRAIKVLQNADAVICEEFRQGSTLLKKLNISGKELLNLNEHNEEENQVSEILQRLLKGQNLALVSDCGTPVFADPGHQLVFEASQFQIPVIPIPGASSLMATLSILDFKLNQFYFAGFLPREKADRAHVLAGLRNMTVPVVLMDTPYRLSKLLEEAAKTFGKNRRITLAMNLTLDNEKILRGSFADIIPQINSKKAEFILVVHNR
jgi:16S rRNA (cytidine1402-2'-O)-methyltransferase